MKRYLPFIIIAIVALITVGAGAAVYRAKQKEVAATTAAADPSGAKPGAKPPHAKGPAKAPVTLEEFADFQCPPCETFSKYSNKLKAEFGDRLRIVFRQYPLTMHQHAAAAARSAEAAGMQGRFWEMHDLLYQNRTTWSAAAEVAPLFEGYAQTLGLDMTQFRKDRDSEQAKTRVAADQERATSLGIVGTPTVFINQQRVPPTALSEQGVRDAINAALNGKPMFAPSPSATPGTSSPAPTSR